MYALFYSKNTRFNYYNIQTPKVSFIPTPWSALFATGQTNGLIIDVGNVETTICPVYDSVCLFSYHVCIPKGAESAKQDLSNFLKNNCSLSLNGTETKLCDYEFDDKFLTDLLSSCSVKINGSSSMPKCIEFPFKNGYIKIPSNLRQSPFETLFTNDGDGSIQESIVTCLQKVHHL
jgi:hypothetical protein